MCMCVLKDRSSAYVNKTCFGPLVSDRFIFAGII